MEFGARNREALREELIRKMKEAYPEYQIEIAVDTDFSQE